MHSAQFLLFRQNSISPNIGGYRYFFNGQEADNEVFGENSLFAFEYRMHDARLGRFWSVDPLAAKYPWNSTYAFAENSPIGYLEMEGLEAVVGISMGGNVEYRKGLLKSVYSTAIVKTILAAEKSNEPNEIEQLRRVLVDATTNDPEHSIGFIAIWGHGIENKIFGKTREKITVSRITTTDLSELKKSVENGDITFTQNACILITACNAGSDAEIYDETGEPQIKSFAQELADITGAIVYAGRNNNGEGGVCPKEEKRGSAMSYQMKDYKKGSFYKFKKGENPEEIGDVIDMLKIIEQGTGLSNQNDKP